jgi:UPF0716 protein FxsA
VSRLLLLFVVVPAVELVLLIEIGQRIGTLPTLGLIVVTGALGAYLARRQGVGVLRRMRQETAAGRLPAAPVMDGIIILIAAALLVTPGILTDAFGFFCLIPPCRELLKRYLKAWLERAIRQGTVTVSIGLGSGSSAFSDRTVRDVTPKGDPRAEDDAHRRLDEPSQEGRSGKADP